MRAEIARRQSRTQAVIDLFAQKPLIWIHWKDVAVVGGACAWRTRISDARQFFETEGAGTIEWNKQTASSCYRLVPYPRMGPSADQYREARLF